MFQCRSHKEGYQQKRTVELRNPYILIKEMYLWKLVVLYDKIVGCKSKPYTCTVAAVLLLSLTTMLQNLLLQNLLVILKDVQKSVQHNPIMQYICLCCVCSTVQHESLKIVFCLVFSESTSLSFNLCMTDVQFHAFQFSSGFMKCNIRLSRYYRELIIQKWFVQNRVKVVWYFCFVTPVQGCVVYNQGKGFSWTATYHLN